MQFWGLPKRGKCPKTHIIQGSIVEAVQEKTEKKWQIRGKSDDMQVCIVDDERNGAHSGEAAHGKRGAGGTAEGKGACFLGWQRAGT